MTAVERNRINELAYIAASRPLWAYEKAELYDLYEKARDKAAKPAFAEEPDYCEPYAIYGPEKEY